MTKFLTFDPRKNKKVLVGEIIGDTLFKEVKPSHFMRVVDGYGIQEIAFQELGVMGVKYIILILVATREQWVSTFDNWLNHSKVADYGNGKQRFLSLKYMKKPKTNVLIADKAKSEKIFVQQSILLERG